MGWLGDIAILVAMGVGGWWFLNNYKTLGIGGGGAAPGGNGSAVPPLADGTGTGTGEDPTQLAAKCDASIDTAWRTAQKVGSLSECNKRYTASMMKCKCEKSSKKDGTPVTAVICEQDGIRCPVSDCGQNIAAVSATFAKKIPKCTCQNMKSLVDVSPECANLVTAVGVGGSGGGTQAMRAVVINTPRYYKTRPPSRFTGFYHPGSA